MPINWFKFIPWRKIKSWTPCFSVGKYPKCGEAKFDAKIVKDDDLPPNAIRVQERKLIERVFYVIESSFCRYSLVFTALIN